MKLHDLSSILLILDIKKYLALAIEILAATPLRPGGKPCGTLDPWGDPRSYLLPYFRVIEEVWVA
jgi:hypothetical protein